MTLIQVLSEADQHDLDLEMREALRTRRALAKQQAYYAHHVFDLLTGGMRWACDELPPSPTCAREGCMNRGAL